MNLTVIAVSEPAPGSRVFPYEIDWTNNNTVAACLNQCAAFGYPVAGLEYGSQCCRLLDQFPARCADELHSLRGRRGCGCERWLLCSRFSVQYALFRRPNPSMRCRQSANNVLLECNDERLAYPTEHWVLRGKHRLSPFFRIADTIAC